MSRFPHPSSFPWVKFKEIVFSNEMPNDLAKQLEAKAVSPITEEQERRLIRNLWQAQKVFVSEEYVGYQELDSVDNPDAYTENDVVEIFIRANSGGTKLGKSDLLFSLLTASWQDADEAAATYSGHEGAQRENAPRLPWAQGHESHQDIRHVLRSEHMEAPCRSREEAPGDLRE